MKRLLIILGTTLALVATSPPDNGQPAPTCTIMTGTFKVAGSCGWDGGVTISPASTCMARLDGAFTAIATDTPDGGRLQFEDPSSVNDAGTRLCAARAFPDGGGLEVICDRCPNSGNCRPDCTAAFTP